MFGIYCGRACDILGGGTIVGQTTHAMVADKLKIRGVTVSGAQDTGLYVQRSLKMTGVTVSGCEYGTWAPGTVQAIDCTVTSNVDIGILGDRVRLMRSTVTGNGVDLVTERLPRLKDSTCETSNSGSCALD